VMLSPAERRRARDFNARVSGRRGAERRHPERGADRATDRADRAGAERRTIDHPGRSRHAGQHAAPPHSVGVHRAPPGHGPDEVTDLVRLADRLGSAGAQVRADDEFRDRLRQRLIAVASVHGINAEPGFRPPPAVDREPGLRAFPVVRHRVPRRITVVSGTLAGLVALSGVGFASGGANPGDALYGVKRSRETAQLTLARSAVARGQLHLGFARNRLSEAAAAVRDPAQLRRLLADMDSDTRLGMADLGTAAATQHHPAPLDLVDEFAALQRRELTSLVTAPTSPAQAKARIRISLALLDRIRERSSALRPVLRCPDPFTSDDLGPVPRPCSGSSAEGSGLPSDDPTTPWPSRRYSDDSDSTSPTSGTDRSDGAADTGRTPPGTVGRTSSAAVVDDGRRSDRTARARSSAGENMVSQSGSVLPGLSGLPTATARGVVRVPTFTTAPPTDPLVELPSDPTDSVVTTPLVSVPGQTAGE